MQNMLEKVYIKVEGVVEKKLNDELILVPLSHNIANMNEVFTLNEVGSFIYNCFDGVTNVEVILEKMLLEFDVEKERAVNDINDFIHVALKKNVITVKK